MATNNPKAELDALFEAQEKCVKEGVVTQVKTCRGLVQFTPIRTPNGLNARVEILEEY